jgi:hypothetical protein
MEQRAQRKADPAMVGKTISPAGWKNIPSLMDLKQDLTDAQPSHDAQVTKIRDWLDNLRIEGAAIPKTPKGHSKLQPKLIRKQAEWRYAALSEPLLSNEDMFAIDPVTWEDVEPARQNKLVLDNQWRTKIDRVKFIDEYVRTAVDEGTVIVKLNWNFQEESYEEQEPVYKFTDAPQLAELHSELHQLMQTNPTGYKDQVPAELMAAHEESMRRGRPMQADVVDYVLVKKSRTVVNKPRPEVCDYRNVIIDPTCKGVLADAGFIIHSFETSTSNLRKDGKYTNVDNIVVDANSSLNTPDHATDEEGNFSFKDEPRKKFVAFEKWGYWDIFADGIARPIVATWVGDTIIRMEESPHPDKALPFVIVQTMPVRGSVYGEPDGELLIENQKIIGAVTRGMIDVMGKSANGQMGTRKDALDAINWRKFQLGQDYQYNGNVDPRVAFYMHQYPEIPQSAQFMLQLQNIDAESMTGVKAFSSNGLNAESLGSVATGIRGALDAASKREMGILRRLAAGIVDIARKIISMNAEFLEDEEIIRITNENIVAIRRKDLAGNFDLRVTISTPEEEAARAQGLEFLLQTIGNNLDPKLTQLILRDITRLKKMPELSHEIENYKPEPDPIEQRRRELENLELEAKIAELQARALEHQSDAELNGAQAGTAQAKSRQLHSVSDQQDLSFVEQESGVTQEREKELQGEQARSNMHLKQFEHDLNRQDVAEDSSITELQKYLGKK